MKIATITTTALAALALVACSSGSTPSTTPGNSTPAPQPSDTSSSGLQIDPNASPFCAALAGLEGVDNDITTASDDITAITGDSATWNDPAVLAQLHADGQKILDNLGTVTMHYDDLKTKVDDPAVIDALQTMSDLYTTFFGAEGQAAVDAASVTDYSTSLLTIVMSTDVQNLMTKATDAADTLTTYAETSCSFGFSG